MATDIEERQQDGHVDPGTLARRVTRVRTRYQVRRHGFRHSLVELDRRVLQLELIKVFVDGLVKYLYQLLEEVGLDAVVAQNLDKLRIYQDLFRQGVDVLAKLLGLRA